MTRLRVSPVLAVALALAGAPLAVSSGSLAAASSPPLYSGRSVHKMKRAKRPSSGSYTNGVPDGANTGSRKQTPTGGNPGAGNHS